MALREDIREDIATTVSNIVAMAVHAKDQEYAAIQDNITDCIVRLDRIEAKLNGESAKLSASKFSRWLVCILNNEKIEAIREVRELTGLSLKEAKDLVEYWQDYIKV